MSSSEENTSPGLRRDAHQTGGANLPSDIDGTASIDQPSAAGGPDIPTGAAQGLTANASGTTGYGAGMGAGAPVTGMPSTSGAPMPGTAGAGPSGTADTAKQEAADVAQTAQQEAGRVASTAKQEAGAVAHEAKSQLQGLYHQTQSELREQAATQQKRVAEGLRTVSEQLRTMAESTDQGIAADVVRQVSTRAESVSTWLDNRDPGSLLSEVKSYARRSPGTFIAIAALAGLAAGRLTRALADSGSESGDQEGRIQGDRI